MPEVQDITLSVPDISCEHCVRAINTSLGGLTGVEKVVTDIPTRTVYLRFHPDQLSLQEIEVALDDIGYTVAK
jgi:copper chaperone